MSSLESRICVPAVAWIPRDCMNLAEEKRRERDRAFTDEAMTDECSDNEIEGEQLALSLQYHFLLDRF